MTPRARRRTTSAPLAAATALVVVLAATARSQPTFATTPDAASAQAPATTPDAASAQARATTRDVDSAQAPATTSEAMPSSPFAPAADARAARLGELRQEIEAGHERIAAYEARTQGLLDALQSIDEASEQLGVDVKRAAAELGEARRRLVAARAGALQAEARLEATRARLGRRVVALAREGEAGVVRAFFAPGTLPERSSRVSLLRRLAARDAVLLERHRAELRAVDEAQAAVAAATAERDGLAGSLAQKRSTLAEEKAARQLLLRRLRADAARERDAVRELEGAARALEAKLAALGAALVPPGPPTAPGAPAGEPFASLRGRLPPPVDAPLRRSYGRVVDADFRTETFRKGVDFGAREGETVRAVARGNVRFAGWFRGYGKMVIVDHGEQYFTVSGHLDEIRVAVGDAVEAGSVIGAAGDTGSLSGALLYFELRRGGEALDPAEWLERGRLVAPPRAGG